METNKSSKSKKNWRIIQNEIDKRMPNFLLSKEKNPKAITSKSINENVVKINKDDMEIIINCNDSYKTIPDNIYNYICSIDSDIKQKNKNHADNIISHRSDKNINTNVKNQDNKLNEKKTKGGKKYRNSVGKKTRRKKKK